MKKLLKPCAVLLCYTLWAAYAQPVKLGCGVAVETCFSYTHTCEAAIVQAIQTAQKRLWLAGYGFTSNNIAQAIKEAHTHGVKVHLVLDKSNLTARYSRATYLANAGVDIKIDKHYAIMHHVRHASRVSNCSPL